MSKITLCGALFSLISLSAQDPDKRLAEAKAQLDAVMSLDTSMVSGPTVKGAPYSAQAVNEMVQTLSDGNRITNTSTSTLYRDSQGRERREESSGRTIFITDPLEGVSYTLEPNSKVARKNAQRLMTITSDGGRGGTTVTQTLTVTRSSSGEDMHRVEILGNRVNLVTKADSKVEHLGTQTIEGVAAEGTRTTMTIPAGQIGNELPIVTTNERWYSPELQVTVMSKRSDPRTGTTTYKLTNINRSEPAPSLFQVPSDYTVSEPETRRTVVIKPEEDQ